MTRFQGKTVIITGAGSGIGAGVARTFSSEGANVILIGRTRAKLEAVAADLPDDRTVVHPGDVADPATGESATALADQRFGGLDVLVNNAATFTMGDIEATSADDFARLLGVNIGGYFNMAKAALPSLRKAGGSIVMVSSVSGIGGDWGMMAYDTTKGAVSNMVRAMALDYAAQGVRVNAVAPSLTDTEITKDIQSDDTLMAKFMERIPMGRIATPEDIARVVLFLASEEAGYVTGVVLPVDGGLSASNGQPHL